jgi:serine/threonine protein phosphatase PrpC
MRRGNNEDNYLVLPLGGNMIRQEGEAYVYTIESPGLLLGVADGMGGHQSGEIASKLCVEHLASELYSRVSDGAAPPAGPAALLQQAVVAAHLSVFQASGQHELLHGMGSTLTAVLLHDHHAYVAQVGDSRAYLLRQGELRALTEDQTVGNILKSSGGVELDSRYLEMLSQAVGVQEKLDVVMTAEPLQPGDVVLVCSDGLYKAVSTADIHQALLQEKALNERAQALVTAANHNGGPDNITVVLAEIQQDN